MAKNPSRQPPSKGGGGSGNKNEKPAPIDVPRGYRATNPDGSPATRYAPGRAKFEPAPKGGKRYVAGSGLAAPRLYRAGDQFSIANRSPQDIMELQQQLVRIGLIDPKEVQWGVADTNTTTAFSSLLGYANQAGTEWEDELDYRVTLAEQTGFDPNAAPERAPLVIEQTATDDEIRGAYDQAGTETIGRGLTPEEEAAKIAAFREGEVTSQTERYNMAETGGTASAGPTLSPAGLASELEREKPEEFKATQIGEKGQQILDLLTNRTQAGGSNLS